VARVDEGDAVALRAAKFFLQALRFVFLDRVGADAGGSNHRGDAELDLGQVHKSESSGGTRGRGGGGGRGGCGGGVPRGARGGPGGRRRRPGLPARRTGPRKST